MKLRVLIFITITVLISSCGEYEKILKSTDYDLKKEKVKEYYDNGQYVRASEVLSQILTRFRGTEEAEELNWINAQCYYRMRDYMMASNYFKVFIDQYPFGERAEEAYFLSAMCDYYLSPGPELDQQNTTAAIEGFNIFINRFPSSPRLEEASMLVKELEEKLVEKSYLSARLYYDMNEYKAAVVALTNSLKEYVDTKYREEMMYLKLNSLFLYAENSLAIRQKERYQDTLDQYYSFMEEFPESQYAREVNNIYEKTSRFLRPEDAGS